MDSERTIMQKEILVKDDGRRLIYYRFVPAGDAPEPPEAEPLKPETRESETQASEPKEP